MEDCIIRYETDGILIWSQKEKAYFCSKLKEDNEKVDQVLNGIITTGDIYEEMNKIGATSKNKKIIKTQSKEKLMAPLEYYFDFTNVCNLKCSHCYNRQNMNTHTMTVHQIKKIIYDMYDSGVMRLHLAGGEPTLFPEELEAYMSEAKKYGIVTSMASNGIVITDTICEILEKNDVMSITISIEAANADANDKIRGKGSLQKAIKGIKKLSEYRKIHNAKYMIGIKVSYDVDINENEFEDLIKLSKELEVDVLKFANPERCLFHESGYYSKKAIKYYKNMDTIRRLKEKYNDEIFITQIASPVNNCPNIGLPEMKGCIGAQELIAINCKGEITPCLMNDTYLGNIFELNSIKELYKSKVISDYYNKIKNYECGDCKFHEKCRGGCQVRKIVEYGKIENVDPLCPVKNAINTETRFNQNNSKFMKINVLHSL